MAVRPLSLFQYKIAAAFSSPVDVCNFVASELPRRVAKLAAEVSRQPQLRNSSRFSAALTAVSTASHLETRESSAAKLVDYACHLRSAVNHTTRELTHLVDVQREAILDSRRRNDVQVLASLSHTLDVLQFDLIGCRTMVNDMANRCEGRAGVVRSADPAELARDVAESVRAFAVEKFGAAPEVEVVVAAPASKAASMPLSCMVVPEYLQFALSELLKNSVAASVERFGAAALDDAPPVIVTVSGDREFIGICVADSAGGIPGRPGVTDRFAYFGSTAPPPVVDSYHYSRTHGAPFSGLGLGLLRSRLYAHHLGGSLALVSQPGRGVDAHLVVDRSGVRSRDVWLDTGSGE